MTAAAEPGASVVVRDAAADDLSVIQAIYAYHVATGLASFEEAAPDIAEMGRRRAEVVAHGLPYLVAGLDGAVRGFAYATPYRDRSAYRYSVENSVYVADDWRRRGIAAALLRALIARCTDAGMRQMVAVIGDSANAASIGLHARLGFRHAGTLPSVGYKFGRWVDSVFMTLPLGDGERTKPEI